LSLLFWHANLPHATQCLPLLFTELFVGTLLTLELLLDL
jgi:hypothetical protein